jgi:hypothetical protein
MVRMDGEDGMRNRTGHVIGYVVTALVAAATGLIVGMIIAAPAEGRASAERGPASTEVGARTPRATADTGEPRTAHPDSRPDDRPPPGPAQPDAAGDEFAAAARLIRRALDPAVRPTGTGVISGRVVTVDGVGVPDALIVVAAVPLDPPGTRPVGVGETEGEPVDPGDPDALRRWVDAQRTEAALRWTATTGADGGFEIAGLLDNRVFRVSAQRRGMRITNGRATVAYVTPGASLLFLAEPVVEVPIRVVRADGQPVGAAEIRISGESRRRVWRPDSPPLILAPGRYDLRAVDLPHRDGDSGTQTILVEAGTDGSTAPVILTLIVRPGLRGTVRPAEPTIRREPADMWIKAVKLAPGATPDPAALTGRDAESAFIDDVTGVYHLADLAPGRYLVGVLRPLGPRWRPVVLGEVTIGREPVERHWTLPPPPDDAVVVVDVRGPGGTRLADVTFEAVAGRRGRGGVAGAGGVQVERLADGRFRVFHPLTERDDEGRRLLHVRAPGLGTVELAVADDQREATVRFAPAGELTVTIPGFASRADTEFLRLAVVPGTEEPASVPYGIRPRDDGSVVFRPLAPGPHVVMLITTAHAPWRLPPAVQRVDVVAGRQTASLSVPPMGPLTVTVPGEIAPPTSPVFLYRRDAGGAWQIFSRAYLDETGRAGFPPVPDIDVQIGVAEQRMTTRTGAGGQIQFIPDATDEP